MESVGQPLEALLAAMNRFVRAPELKLLHVEVAVRMRKACLEAVLAFERHPRNTSAFYSFEHEHTASAPGWAERAEHARGQHAHRASGMAEHGEQLPPLPGRPTSTDPSARFAATALQLEQHRPPQSQGLVVVLAPTTLDAVERWKEALTPLLTDPALAAVRFICLETPPAPTAGLAEALGERGLTIQVVPAPQQKDRDVETLLTRMVPGGPLPGAAPSVAPPAHPSARPTPSPTPDARLRGLVARKLIDSALAMKQGRAAEAVQSTREARDLCARAGLHRDAINFELVLGGQLLAAGSSRQSEAAFERAVATATEQDKTSQAATGQFALGATKLGRRDSQGALVCYAEGTVAAERSHQPALAIEGGRLTGQLAAALGLPAQAIAFWTKSVKLAEAAGPQAPLTSAGESARSLAAMCRKRGLADQAAKFEAQADQLENVVVPATPTALSDLPDDGVTPEPSPDPASAQHHDRSPAVPLAATEGVAPSSPGPAAPVPVVPAPVSGPIIFGAPPSDDEEGTDLLTMDDIARMHWGVEAASAEGLDLTGDGDPGSPPVAGLDEAQLEKLRTATVDVLDDESTSMLSRAELAVLHGEAPFVLPERPGDAAAEAPPPVPTPPPAEDDLGFDLLGLQALRDQRIEDEDDGGSTLHRRDAFEDEDPG